MAYVIAQIWAPLLIAAMCGAVAGWFWHTARLRPRHKALDAERRRLRAELLELATGAAAPVTAHIDETSKRRIAELERALAEARGRGAEADVLRRRVADLERNAGPVRPAPAIDVTDYTTRIAALEIEIEAARRKVAEAEALQARLAELQASSASSLDLDLVKWRARFFEGRTRELESSLGAAVRDLAALKEGPEEAPAVPAAKPAKSDAEQLVWRNRYLTERLRYLESAPTPISASSPASDPEEENRRRWRMRYLEQRLARIESARHDDTPPAVDVTALQARIAELEQAESAARAIADKVVEAEDDVIRARWTARYLQARVGYLETQARMAMAAREAHEKAAQEARDKAAQEAREKTAQEALDKAAQEEAEAERLAAETAASARVVATPPPPAPVEIVRMERPAPLSAPRAGAPDDLTRINGVSEHLQGALRGLGVHHYDQIAAWSPAHAAWVNQYLNLAGRIARERWIEQAKALAAG